MSLRNRVSAIVGLLTAVALIPGNALASPALGVWAEQTLIIGSGTRIHGADLGVHSALDTGPVQIQIGSEVDLGASSVYGHRISLGSGTVIGHLYADSVTNTGGTYGSLSPFPLVLSPPHGTVQPGTVDVIVPANGSATLSPGSYRTLAVQANASLYLAGGLYDAFSMSVASGARVVVEGASLLRVASLFAENWGMIGPDRALGVDLNLRIQVMGGNSSGSGGTPAVYIAPASFVAAVILAPNGTIQVGDHSVVIGGLDGKFVNLGESLAFGSSPTTS